MGLADLDPDGLEECWQGGEVLRSLLKPAGATPDRGWIWNALTEFSTHCADSEVTKAPPAVLPSMHRPRNR